MGCVHQHGSVWYLLDVELNCVLFEKLKCRITQWSSKNYFSFAEDWASKDSAPLYYLCLGRTESLLSHSLDKGINSCEKGPKWGSAWGPCKTFVTLIDEFSSWIVFWTSMQNFVLLSNVFVLISSNYCKISCYCPSIAFRVCSASRVSGNTVFGFLSVWQFHTWRRWTLHWMMSFQIFFKVKKKIFKVTLICGGENTQIGYCNFQQNFF